MSEGCRAVTRSAVPRAGQQDTGVGGTGSPRGPHGCPSPAGVCDGISPPTPTVPSRSPPRRPPGTPQGWGPAARPASCAACHSHASLHVCPRVCGGGANPYVSCGSDLRVGNRRACEPAGRGPGETPRGRGGGGVGGLSRQHTPKPPPGPRAPPPAKLLPETPERRRRAGSAGEGPGAALQERGPLPSSPLPSFRPSPAPPLPPPSPPQPLPLPLHFSIYFPLLQKHIEGGEKGNIKIHCEPHSGLTISNEPRLG